MRGYPPRFVFRSPTKTPVPQPSFPVQTGVLPPSHALRCPPHPIKVRYPLSPPQGVGLTQTHSPHSCTKVRGVPPTTISLRGVGTPPCPFILHLSPLTFVWNSRWSAAISGQCQTGGIPHTRVDQVTPSPPCSGPGAYPPPTPSTHGGGGSYPLLCFVLCDGGLYVHSPRFLCKRGGTHPSHAMGGTPCHKS